MGRVADRTADPAAPPTAGRAAGRAATVAGALRVSLQGPTGRHDLVVTPDLLAGDLVVPVVDAVLGDTGGDAPAILTRSGLVLDPDLPVGDQGVRDGDLLVVAPTGTRSRSGALRPRRAAADVPLTERAPWVVTVGAVVVGAMALLALATADPAGRRAWCLALLLACAAAVLLAGAGERAEVVRVTGTVVGAGATALLQAGGEPGQGLLALTAGSLALAVLAALARTGGHGRDEPLLVLVGTGVVAALVLGSVLLAGASAAVGWALLGALVLPVVRLVPGAVVDVPDDVLLELDRLSVTAWTAHDRDRRRSRTRLRDDDVRGTLRRGTLLHSVVVVVGATTAAASGVAFVLLPEPRGLAAPGAVALTGLLAVGMALLSRTIRHRTPKTALLVGAGVCASAATALGLDSAGGTLRAGLVVGTALAVGGLAAVLVAHALGRGWRSVRWARVADALEGLCVALAAPAALLAAGGWEWFRQLPA